MLAPPLPVLCLGPQNKLTSSRMDEERISLISARPIWPPPINTKRFGFILCLIHRSQVQLSAELIGLNVTERNLGGGMSQLTLSATNPKLSGFPIIDNPEFETHRGPLLSGLANLR